MLFYPPRIRYRYYITRLLTFNISFSNKKILNYMTTGSMPGEVVKWSSSLVDVVVIVSREKSA